MELDKFKIKPKKRLKPFKEQLPFFTVNNIPNIKNGTKIDNFYFIYELEQKNKVLNLKEDEKIIKDKNIGISSWEENEKKEEKKKNNGEKFTENKKINKQEFNKINEFSKDNKDEKDLYDLIDKEIFDPKFDIEEAIYKNNQTRSNQTRSRDKLKIYFNNLISLEGMLENNKVNKEINECMSNFNFLPKYYYKFYILRIIKEMEGETNISKIIEIFYQQQKENIHSNINNFYSNLSLKPNKKYEKKNKSEINTYKNLLNLKRCISKTYENPISLYKLYEYSKTFPFKYINIIKENEDEKSGIIFDESLRKKFFKLRYSFPFVENVIDSMIESYDSNDKLNINELSDSAYGNALENKIRKNLNTFQEKIEVRSVWSLNEISESVKKEKLKEIKKKKKYSKRYQDFEDITNIKDIKSSTFNYFYFKPENQSNKYFDSLFLIKISDNEYSIIALQITKNKQKVNVKSKEKYSEFLKDNILEKFEKLYNIKISKLYFLFILSGDDDENDSLCKILNNYKISYAFYSIKDKCFYKERNSNKINSVKEFINQKSLINFEIENNNVNYKYDSNPSLESIKIFETKLYIEYKACKNISFEFIRDNFYFSNFGPKISNKLNSNMIKTFKNCIPFSNEFKIMFLFSFEFFLLNYYKKKKESDELIYLYKHDNIVYLLFNQFHFKINQDEDLVECKSLFIEYLKLSSNFVHHTQEFEFSSIENIYQNNNAYLFKIYYLGTKLHKK